MNFKIKNFVFLKKQADLKTNCTGLSRFELINDYNMLTKKYYFCLWFKSIFKIAYNFLLMS